MPLQNDPGLTSPRPRGPVAASACLLGFPCAYDGKHRRHQGVIKLVGSQGGVAVCPEILGGLSCPRTPCEIAGGHGEDVLDNQARVLTRHGGDVTAAFVAGAREAYQLARDHGCRWAVLEDGSPSCGVNRIHDGTFSGKRLKGRGVTAALFERRGIRSLAPFQAFLHPREDSGGQLLNDMSDSKQEVDS